MLDEMIGDYWNPTQPKEKPQVPHGVYITLDRQIKFGGTKGCPACYGHAKVRSPECRGTISGYRGQRGCTDMSCKLG